MLDVKPLFPASPIHFGLHVPPLLFHAGLRLAMDDAIGHMMHQFTQGARKAFGITGDRDDPLAPVLPQIELVGWFLLFTLLHLAP